MSIAEPAETEGARIARGLRKRDLALLDELVSRYQYRLLRYLVYLTARRDSVEDWAQETWVRVLDRASQYDGRSRFETWLFSIARNLAIDDLRRRRDVTGEVPERASEERASPFAAAARSQNSMRLAAALDMLEPIYREVLLLRFQEEMPLEEISRVTGAPVPTVASRIRRGLERLRSQWEGDSDVR